MITLSFCYSFMCGAETPICTFGSFWNRSINYNLSEYNFRHTLAITMSFKRSHVLPFPVTTSLEPIEPCNEPGSFAHLVEMAWSSESANFDSFDLQDEPEYTGDDLNFCPSSANPGDFDQILTGPQESGYFGSFFCRTLRGLPSRR